MKRIIFVIGSLGIVAIMILLVGGSALGGTLAANALPEVEFLGEGAGTYQTTLDDFIVKRGQEQYDFVAGPTYEAAEGERVWAVRGTKEAPNVVNNSVADLGTAYENCSVEYVGIDDDVNDIRNGFFLGGSLVELIQEGMVFQGSYVTPISTPDHRLVAEESIAYWFTPCEEGEEPTPTNTPDPGDDINIFMPLVMYVGEGEPLPTATPSPTATGTVHPPTMTPTATSEPVSYTLICNPEYDINIVDEEVHFFFSATAYADGDPFENVSLKGTLVIDLDSQAPFNIERTNSAGEADFRMTALVGTIKIPPVATVAFDDQEQYGAASCTVDFSEEPPAPTPAPTPSGGPALACAPDYDLYFPDFGEVSVEFRFNTTAWYQGYPLSGVDLEAELNTGGTTESSIKGTNNDGIANFKIEVPLSTITQTPLVTVTFDDQLTYGNASCTIETALPPDSFLAWIIERNVNGKWLGPEDDD